MRNPFARLLTAFIAFFSFSKRINKKNVNAGEIENNNRPSGIMKKYRKAKRHPNDKDKIKKSVRLKNKRARAARRLNRSYPPTKIYPI